MTTKFDPRVRKLRKLLDECDEVATTMKFFFDNLANHREFIEMGLPNRTRLWQP